MANVEGISGATYSSAQPESRWVRAQLAMEGQAQAPPVGALIFSCNGRGVGLFGEPDFDSRTLASFLPVPSSGFFCNGAPADSVSEAASAEAAAPASY